MTLFAAEGNANTFDFVVSFRITCCKLRGYIIRNVAWRCWVCASNIRPLRREHRQHDDGVLGNLQCPYVPLFV